MYQEALGDGLISSSHPHWHSDSITVADILSAAENTPESASMVADDINDVCMHAFIPSAGAHQLLAGRAS